MTSRSKYPVARRACLSCREKKIKCDGEKVTVDSATNKVVNRSTSVCSNCKSLGMECVFVKSKRGGQRARKPKHQTSAPAIANLIDTQVSNMKPTITRISTNIKPESSPEGQSSPSDVVQLVLPLRPSTSNPIAKPSVPFRGFYPPSNLPSQESFPPPLHTITDYIPTTNYSYPPVSVPAYSFQTYLPRPPFSHFSQPLLRDGQYPMPVLNPPMIALAKTTKHMMPFQPLFVNDPKLRESSAHNAPTSQSNAPLLVNDNHAPQLANLRALAPPGRK